MSTRILDLSNVINVTIQGVPSSLGAPNINTVALFSKETPITDWTGIAYKIFVNATDVGTEFGTGSVAYGIAVSFFSQQPNPISTGGYLTIIPRTSSGTETVQNAIIRTKDFVYYFGILIDEDMHASGATFATLTAYIQTLDKVFFYAAKDTADYAPGGLLDLIRTTTKTNTRCLYYSDGTAADTIKFAAAYASRALSTNFSGSNTTGTMHLKSISGFSADTTVDQTELAKVVAAGVDVYVSIAGVASLFTSGANSYWDQIYNQFWLKFAIETAGFNYLRVTNTKIPQTETGLEGLKNSYRAVCQQGVNNGFIGPGTWSSPDSFGDPEALIRCIKDIGFYVYSSPIATQLAADRTARKAPLIQIAVKCQGAVHSSSTVVNVNL